jgi:cadmium resistance protein CadD (predicted permease)
MICCQEKKDELLLWLGVIAFVIGAVFLLMMFDAIPEETWDYLWPFILVVLGLKLMMMGSSTCTCKITPEPTSTKKTRRKPTTRKRRVAKKK